MWVCIRAWGIEIEGWDCIVAPTFGGCHYSFDSGVLCDLSGSGMWRLHAWFDGALLRTTGIARS